jgi:alcohol dehydrogenase class IV
LVRAARLAHGTALAVVLPEVLGFYAADSGLRDRELALVGVALDAAIPTEPHATAGGRRHRRAAAVPRERRPAPSTLLARFDDAGLDVVAQDAIDDAAIRNSPRLPSLA